MAKATKSENKSNAIRRYMAKNRDANAQQVVDGLKAEGVTVTVGLVYNVKAYDAKKKASKKAAKAAPKPAAKDSAAPTTGSSSGGTKAEAIRAVAKSLPKPFRPLDVRAELAKQGIDATTTFIGKVLRAAGMKRKRRKAANGSSIPSPSDVRAAILARRNAPVTIDDLVAAKKVVSQVGSVEKVREALAALAKLG